MNIRQDVAYYGKLAALKLGYVAGQVEVISSCFQHCRACDSWRDDASGKQKGEWPLSAMKQLVEELATMKTFEHPEAFFASLIPAMIWFGRSSISL